MMFRPVLLTKVLLGEKTMTRRPTKHLEGKCPYTVGSTKAIQPGRGKKHVAHLRVVKDTRHEEVSRITEADAVKEGFRSVVEFARYWAALYGSVDPFQQVCVIEFDVQVIGCCPNDPAVSP